MTSSNSNRPVLITGSHRSGTTFLGRVLAESKELGYVQEPSNPNRSGPYPTTDLLYYQYLPKDYNGPLTKAFDAVLSWRWRLTFSLSVQKTWKKRAEVISRWLDFQRSRITGKRMLLKDPIAFFMAEWIEQRYNAQVVVCVRHPAAFVMSIETKQWRFNFDRWACQTEMAPLFGPYWEQIVEFAKEEKPLRDGAILIWNAMYYVANNYRKDHSDWIFVRNEDVSLDPHSTFKELFQKLGLQYTAEVERYVRRNTSGSGMLDTSRDSKANAEKWKRFFTQEEQEYIKKETLAIWPFFYQESEW